MTAIFPIFRCGPRRALRLLAPGFGALLLAAPPFLVAQQALYVKDDAAITLVMGVRDRTPLIERAGQLVKADTQVYLLQKSPEYEPVLISVNSVRADVNYVEMNGGSELNHNFEFHARLESRYDLENVYLALELFTGQLGKLIYVQEVGMIGPEHPQSISLSVPFLGKISGKYYVHLFVRGNEVLNSTMPEEMRERVLDQMVAKRIHGAEDRPLRPFVGPSPVFPAALRAAKTTGQAVVHIRVDAQGRVQNPQVFSASDPAFGAAALAAIRLWRFLPKVVHGTPTASSVAIPFRFAP